jgi:hypothetical protein
MKADAHYDKAERLTEAQARLDAGRDWELIVEGCYMSAHNFVLAGTEWPGVAHSQGHMHKENVRLLKQAAAPSEVQDAWNQLEVLRAGNVYGARTNGTASSSARAHLQKLTQWATSVRP